jgi:hypothetical protein
MYFQLRLKAFRTWAFAVLVQKHRKSIYKRIINGMSNSSLLASFHAWRDSMANNHPENQLESIETKIDETAYHVQARSPPNFVFYAAYSISRRGSVRLQNDEGHVLCVIGPTLTTLPPYHRAHLDPLSTTQPSNTPPRMREVARPGNNTNFGQSSPWTRSQILVASEASRAVADIAAQKVKDLQVGHSL